MHTDGTEILDDWDRATAMAITRFCVEQPIFTSYSSVISFPVRDLTSKCSRQQIAMLLDTDLPGHVPALGKVIHYAASLLGVSVCDNLQGENVLYRQVLQVARIQEQAHAQQIAEQSQQLAE